MTDTADDSASASSRLTEVLGSSGMASAFALTAIGALFGAHVLVSTMGTVGYSTIIVGLCVIGVAILIVRRREISLIRLMPTTLIVLLGWLLLTAAWSRAPAVSLAGWLALLAPTILAIVVAHTRDTLQTVRAVGDVLRVLLVGSLALEVLSGILIDLPIAFLRIAGNLADGGPIQGLFGTRTRLGLVTVIALITFLVEWRTKSVRPGVSVFSVVLAAILALFTGSPIVLVLAVVTGIATAILAIVRRTPAAIRPRVQIALGALVAIGLLVVYLARRPIVYWLNAAPDFFTRSQLWNAALDMVELRPVQGWGWFGTWPTRYQPFLQIRFETGRDHSSALNAYMDVLLQAGWVGAVLFVAFCGIAVVRAWLIASERRSTVYTWPALILIALLANSVVDSTILGGFGWFLLVLCATRTANVRGWRTAIADQPADEPSLPHASPPTAAPER